MAVRTGIEARAYTARLIFSNSQPRTELQPFLQTSSDRLGARFTASRWYANCFGLRMPFSSFLQRSPLALALVACGPPSPDQATLYEGCSPSAATVTCRDGLTVCRDLAQDLGVGICTMPCLDDADCPLAANGRASCERFTSGALCIVSCRVDTDCPTDTECVERHRIDGSAASICEAT